MEKAEDQMNQEQPAKARAAGIMIFNAGKMLILKRSDGLGWAFPGGGLEDGETHEQAALRECREEMGFAPEGHMTKIAHTDKHGADYTTFMAHHPEQVTPTLNHEHDAFHWATHDEALKLDLHPGVRELLGGDVRSDAAEPADELQIAIAMRDGKLESPQRYENITLFDVRITGTGYAMRVLKDKGGDKYKEFVFRNPDLYLNDEFLMRCQGLPVILEHPEGKSLDSKEFSDRIIGTILLPYIKGNEVWGIAKIYDDESAEIMAKNQLSTSPSVVFRDPGVNEKMDLEDGNHLLIEGKPSLLDHLAIERHGVWDKGGSPSGVKSNTIHADKAETIRADSADPTDSLEGATNMAELNSEEQAKKDAAEAAAEPTLGQVMAAVQALAAKVDQLENAESAEAPAAADAEVAAAPTKELNPAPDNAVASPEIADVAKRVDALEAKTAPVEEGEASKMADCQARADSVYTAFGEKAPAPMMGESLMAYRKRLVTKVQAHSDRFKGANLMAIADSATMDAIESAIYADALVVAQTPATIPAGVLMESVRTDATGRRINEFKGSPSAWTNQFKAQRRRLTGIKTNFVN